MLENSSEPIKSKTLFGNFQKNKYQKGTSLFLKLGLCIKIIFSKIISTAIIKAVW
jgi:hypothetical protein